jgi:hypothetical protein
MIELQAGVNSHASLIRVHMRGPEETWATKERIAELETLTVLPGHRGRGR